MGSLARAASSLGLPLPPFSSVALRGDGSASARSPRELRAAAAMQGAGIGGLSGAMQGAGGVARRRLRRRRRLRLPRRRPRGAAERVAAAPRDGVAPGRAGRPRRRRRRRPRPRRACGYAGRGGRRRPRRRGVDAPRRRAQRRAVWAHPVPPRRGVGAPTSPRDLRKRAASSLGGEAVPEEGQRPNPNPGTLPGPLLRLLVSAEGARRRPCAAPSRRPRPLAPSPARPPPFHPPQPPFTLLTASQPWLDENSFTLEEVHRRKRSFGRSRRRTTAPVRDAAREAARGRPPLTAAAPVPPRRSPRPLPLPPPREDRGSRAMVAGRPSASRSTVLALRRAVHPADRPRAAHRRVRGRALPPPRLHRRRARSTTSRSARRRVRPTPSPTRRWTARAPTATPRRDDDVDAADVAGAAGVAAALGGRRRRRRRGGRACSPTRTRCSRPFWTFERAVRQTAGQLCGARVPSIIFYNDTIT